MKNAQYMGWKTILKGGKKVKVPVDLRSGDVVSALDPAYWMTREDAEGLTAGDIGLAYVVMEEDPYFFVDIDAGMTPGGWSDLSVEICGMFPGAYVEVSQSGTGLHIIGRGVSPDHSCKNTKLHIELYTQNRFVALTGLHARGSAETEHSTALVTLVEKYFKPVEAVEGAIDGWTEGPCVDWAGFEGDDELLAAARGVKSSSSWFGGKASFSELWDADVDALGRSFPTSTDGQEYDASSADSAIAMHLAYWTGRDCERIKRLMLQSCLVRDKWEREDYLDGTILKAARLVKKVHVARGNVDAPEVPDPRGSFLSPQEQITYFAGCTYVLDVHRVHSVKHGGALLRPDQFKAAYAGHSFVMDDTNGNPSRNAWEAFLESRVNVPRCAEGVVFLPNEEPYSLVVLEGQTLLNTYSPAVVVRTPGDVSRFARHLELLFPDERDRLILTSFMAFVVQCPGVRARWAPLIQGVQGNGKTLISQVVAYSVGHKYSHSPKPNELGSKFNAWLPECLFGYIEDLYAPGERNSIIESSKQMIAGDYIDVEAKGVDSKTRLIWANFIINSNYKDAIQKTEGDRRFAPFFTPQQTAEDIRRDMPGAYFKDMYDWLGAGGYAHIADWLYTYPIPDELNPAMGCNRAPLTSSTGEAILAGRGEAEDEVAEAIEAGRIGFRGGWVSSHYLGALLKEAGLERKYPRNKWKGLLADLGYVPHPGLPAGRVNNVVLPDATKPALFVKQNHPSFCKTGWEAAKDYSDCQNDTITRGLSLASSS